MGSIFSLAPKRTAITLAGFALVLTAISTLAHALQYIFGEHTFTAFVRLFNVAGEQNIPTWFASAMLLGCAGLATFIANALKQEQRPYVLHWRGLAFILLYLSIDETAEIHERTKGPLQAVFNTTGFSAAAWIILGIPFVLLFGLVYLKFLLALPSQTRWQLLAAGTIFVFGAIGLETAGAYLNDIYPEQIVARGLLAMGEELCEMLGVAMLVYALLAYIENHVARDLPAPSVVQLVPISKAYAHGKDAPKEEPRPAGALPAERRQE